MDNVLVFPEIRHDPEIDDEELTPRGHAKWANRFRDAYISDGDAESLGRALRHYDVALRGTEKEPLMQAWIICHRLNVYLYDLQRGRVALEDVEAELELAYTTAARAKTLRDREFRTNTMLWVQRTRESLRPHAQIAEDTQELRLSGLRLVGGTAVSGAGGLNPEPAPEAA